MAKAQAIRKCNRVVLQRCLQPTLSHGDKLEMDDCLGCHGDILMWTAFSNSKPLPNYVHIGVAIFFLGEHFSSPKKLTTFLVVAVKHMLKLSK